MINKCSECGKEFYSRGIAFYCSGPHYRKCEACGKQFVWDHKNPRRCCSKECSAVLKKRTCRERYGVDNVSQIDEVRKKISEANSSEAVRTKREATCLAKYGVKNVAKNAEIRKKLVEVMKSSEYLEKRAQTCIERYGYSSPMQSDTVKQKRQQYCIDKYGQPHPPRPPEIIQYKMTDSSKLQNYLSFKEDPGAYIKSKFDVPVGISTLVADLGVTDTPIYDVLAKNKCSDLLEHTYSRMEDEVIEFLRSLDSNIEIKRCDRTIISPYEIDIWLPEYRLGIECNPASTHNSSKKCPWGSDAKSPSYHRMKSVMALENDAMIFHIFGYEWNSKKEIIQSMLQNLIKHNSEKVYARSTYVSILDYRECKEFLDANHRQGNCSSSYRLGLRMKTTDDLIAVMTFGKMRGTMGSTSSTEHSWELSRFCSKLGCNVVGGASKLLRYFEKHEEPKEIISFSDVSHTTGSLYEVLGFTPVGEVPPSYTWVDIYDKVYYNRVSCQKSNLRNLFEDDSIDIQNHTESEIMEDHGFVKVFDSGKIKWVKKPEVLQ